MDRDLVLPVLLQIQVKRRLEDQEEVGDPPLAVEAGAGIEVQAVAGAWRVSATGETGETGETADAVLAVVTGGTAAAGYTVSLYADGLDKDSTGTGILHVPECAAYTFMDLPLNSVLLAHATMVTLTGGSEA